jgi:hypothetical protein
VQDCYSRMGPEGGIKAVLPTTIFRRKAHFRQS